MENAIAVPSYQCSKLLTVPKIVPRVESGEELPGATLPSAEQGIAVDALPVTSYHSGNQSYGIAESSSHFVTGGSRLKNHGKPRPSCLVLWQRALAKVKKK